MPLHRYPSPCEGPFSDLVLEVHYGLLILRTLGGALPAVAEAMARQSESAEIKVFPLAADPS